MHGLIVLDKPAGVTSHRALAPVKASLPRGTKVGHAGTLDSFATGVLIVMVGDGTRLFDALGMLPKEYEAVVRFGEETDTLDPVGEIVRREHPGPQELHDLAGAVAPLVGEIDQVPPVYSALKVGGRRASDRVRSGETPELAPRRVTIYDLDILPGPEWPDVGLRVRCSSGTYVRAIARDLGASLGLPARLESLRRTAIGPFRAPTAAGEVVPMFDALAATPVTRVALEGDHVVDFGHGRPVAVDRADADLVGVVDEDRRAVLGLARVEAGVLRPSRVFADGRPNSGC
ncbi:MAG: tRNA pseudouridine(55) synthase TruB [Planctomycetota bacterium]